MELQKIMIMLYHYNSELFDDLRSLVAQGRSKNIEGLTNDGPFGYSKSISFFFKPIPKDLPNIFDGNHEFWTYGKELYEYEIPLSNIPDELYYRIVESNEKTDLIRNKQDWSLVNENNLKLKDKYIKELFTLENKLHYTGKGIKEFLLGYSKVSLDIRKDYINSYKYILEDKEPELLSKYAPYVPHLMLYADKNPIIYSKAKKIKLSGKRNLFKF